MACRTAEFGDGGIAVLCARAAKVPVCVTPGCQRRGEFLHGTCDRACCAAHRTSVGDGRDYCGPHMRLLEREYGK